MMKKLNVIGLLLICNFLIAQNTEVPLTEGLFSSFRLRNIGPALMSGRIADIVKDPVNPSTWYVAVASGGVWKTTNNATTWESIFENYGSYTTGSLAIDTKNPNVIWLGTGENASHRSAGYGDGVYKSLDGGASWSNVGLKNSEHIGKILIDPRNSDVVYVAAQGPLWAAGGDRGLFKTLDGGKTWKNILNISENTGVTDIVFDPRNPDIIYAASYQRRRHVGILVAGGPESAIYKTTDGGENWKKLTRGIPSGDKGRIALAVSPQQPDIVYALIAAEEEQSGFFRSVNQGESWSKQNNYIVVDPQYYGEIYADPHHFDRVYAVDVIINVTDDGGKNFRPLNTRNKHVDNHAIVFDPLDPDYLMVGCDGGIYESWDQGDSWKYVSNLPITQFYRVGLDNAMPFYNVYGGTQDNSTLGGPSRTTNVHGIRNEDWIIPVGGDGFQTRVDPENPDILYSMSQYAGIVRYDKRSGERVDIQPQPEIGEDALRWYWDAPLIISPHNPQRLYFAAQKLYRSDDRGNSWTPISKDLSRGLDRNQRLVMGRIWPPEAVWKNVFTSPYGTIVSLSESPLKDGLICIGTDDGLIQITEDGGKSWRKIDKFPGVPDMAYVSDVFLSQHDINTVYALFNNYNEGDFKPYVLKSTDLGRTWTSIAKTLPDRHITWTIVEDHVDKNLLFLGTEFGLFFSNNGGNNWIPLKGNVPTVAVRDLEIQKRENDLVAATFGYGFLIFDDYSPLRNITSITLSKEGILYPVKNTWMYYPSSLIGGEKGSQGDAYFAAPNPPLWSNIYFLFKK
ncbi:MAG: glycosyl hydrolase [Saprospiraceae bacterium]|nr:glycosyl hydrolase [Saprospiraceae bacterium]